MPIIGPDGVDVDSIAVAEPMTQCHRPRGVDPGAQRREQDESPVPDLVAEPLDDKGLVGGQHSGRLPFLCEILNEIPRRQVVQMKASHEVLVGLLRVETSRLADEGADRSAGLYRPPHRVAMPERHAGRSFGGRRHDLDPIVSDL